MTPVIQQANGTLPSVFLRFSLHVQILALIHSSPTCAWIRQSTFAHWEPTRYQRPNHKPRRVPEPITLWFSFNSYCIRPFWVPPTYQALGWHYFVPPKTNPLPGCKSRHASALINLLPLLLRSDFLGGSFIIFINFLAAKRPFTSRIFVTSRFLKNWANSLSEFPPKMHRSTQIWTQFTLLIVVYWSKRTVLQKKKTKKIPHWLSSWNCWIRALYKLHVLQYVLKFQHVSNDMFLKFTYLTIHVKVILCIFDHNGRLNFPSSLQSWSHTPRAAIHRHLVPDDLSYQHDLSFITTRWSHIFYIFILLPSSVRCGQWFCFFSD